MKLQPIETQSMVMNLEATVSRHWITAATNSAGTLLVLAVAAFAWQQLVVLVGSGSERFYLLLPPLAAALFLLWVRPSRAQLCKLWKPLVFNVLCASLLIVVGAVGLALAKVPWQYLPRMFRVSEFLPVLYFFLSVQILLVLLYTASKQFAWTLAGLVRPSNAPLSSEPRREIFARLMGGLMIVVIGGPVLLGALFVHRPKIASAFTAQEALGRSAEWVEFKTADGLRLDGWFVPAATGETSRTVVICHGLAGSKACMGRFLGVADQLHANALLFDFRGHGQSDGHTLSFGYREKDDVLAAVEYLRTQRPQAAHEVYGFGVSMGTAALTMAAAEVEPPLAGVILDSPFANAEDMIGQFVPVPQPFQPWCAELALASAKLHSGCPLLDVNPEQYVDRIRAPLLIVHARGDTLIPLAHADRMFQRAVEPKRIWISSADFHTEAMLREQKTYLQQVEQLFVDPHTADEPFHRLVHAQLRHAE